MKKRISWNLVKHLTLPVVLLPLTLPALAQQPSAAERVGILRATMAASQAVLRQYDWIETTVVSLKGEEKPRKQERCYYEADGALQKVEISETNAGKEPRGPLHHRIAEKKKEEFSDYIRNTAAPVRTYVPPRPAKIQAVKDAGNVSIEVLDLGKRARLNFKNYEKPGDNLGGEVDLTNNRPKVATYLDDASDAVTLDVRMGQLGEGTIYPADITLSAKEKELTVAVTNSGYRRVN